MKKIILIFAILGMFTFISPKEISAEPQNPCTTIIIECPDGTSHYIIFCDLNDLVMWNHLLCGASL
ncbi:MAG: hypothetical protein J7J86_09870 [Bacteroidales bacterium]|nr:hypothetical protein [Bacteroidales bacterium]